MGKSEEVVYRWTHRGIPEWDNIHSLYVVIVFSSQMELVLSMVFQNLTAIVIDPKE